jgi:cytochrome c553
MRSKAGIVIMALACVATAVAADGPPMWAYGTPPAPSGNPPGRGAAPQAAPDDGSLKHLAGSSTGFTLTQIRDGFGPADWYPGDHPPMPEIVAHGRKPDVRACSLCHYPNGKGRSENAPIIGYPTSYFIQQMVDFKNGVRKSADPRKANTNVMAAIAKAMTDDEVKAAAEYFGSMKWTPWVKVMESATAPKTRIQGGLFLALPGGETEPLGQRIIEVPVNAEATEVLRDPHSGFIAYAPMGSLKKGEGLAKSAQCGLCHGADLRGIGPIPAIAGRSPSYIMRQMYDMQTGARKGQWTGLMTPVVSKLSEDDMLALSAYAASLAP